MASNSPPKYLYLYLRPHLKAALAATLCAALFSLASTPAQAQGTPPAPGARAAAQAPMAAASTPAAKPKKRRSVRHAKAAVCTPLNDPWDNLCTIHKKAEIACSDLPTPGAKKTSARAKRKAMQPSPAMPGNPRQECVDAYMRNV